MDLAARVMLVAGALLAAGVLSSRLSSRSGIPLVLLFTAVGFLAGPEGFFGIRVEALDRASGLSIALLALILFDGGLGTPFARIRRVAGPSLTLATVGVVVTAVIVAAAAVWLLGLRPLEGLLLGSIVGSTDAAAVFAALHSRRFGLPRRLGTILEVESGLNDPMAIFLTVTLTGILLEPGHPPGWVALLGALVLQAAVGIGVGVAAGRATAWAMRGVALDAPGLYLVLSSACALVAFGAAQLLGGSGAASVYVAGITLGGARLPFERAIRRFHDGAAWIAQVGVFVLLGLIALPSRVAAEAPHGLALAAVLVLVARPIAVWLSVTPFGLGWREQAVLACGGLRGAVPVILATIPLAAGLPQASTLFSLVFFAVMASVLAQGSLLAPLARRLRLVEPYRGEPAVSLELTALRETGQELLGYRVEAGSPAARHPIRELPLPTDALITLVVRGHQVIAPRGSTVLEPDDLVYVLHGTGSGTTVSAVFAPSAPDDAISPATTETPLPLDARLATVGDVADFYGVLLDSDTGQPLADWLVERLARPAVVGERIDLEGISLTVLTTQEGRPHLVSVELPAARDPASGP